MDSFITLLLFICTFICVISSNNKIMNVPFTKENILSTLLTGTIGAVVFYFLFKIL